MATEIQQKKTFDELGLNPFGQSPLSFIAEEQNKTYLTPRESGVSSANILSGEIVTNLVIRGRMIVKDESTNRVLIGEGKGLF